MILRTRHASGRLVRSRRVLLLGACLGAWATLAGADERLLPATSSELPAAVPTPLASESSALAHSPSQSSAAPPPSAPSPSATPLPARPMTPSFPLILDSLLDSPRASVSEFLELARAGEFAEAARFLDTPSESDAPLLARRLLAVLDREIWLDVSLLAAEPAGDADDGLPPGVEQIGSVPGVRGPEPVRLVRRAFPEGMRWVFSRSTVLRVNGWYERLQDRWIQEYLPPVLLRYGPYDLMWWQWMALSLLGGLALLLGKGLSYLTQRILGRLAARTAATWDDALVARARAPLTLGWALIVLRLTLPWLELYAPAEKGAGQLLHAGLFIAVFWLVLRSVDVVREHLLASPAAAQNPATTSLIPLVAKSLKIAIVLIVGVAVLSELGYPVASLIAGLGIGGVVLALAAQKTVENLFGSLSIGIDQPFRVGDYVAVDSVQGTVELIGLRSTRIRTLDRTVITIPNGKLADMRIESFTARDRIRLQATIGLVYGTTAAQLRQVLEGIRSTLRDHPRIWPEQIPVYFARFGASALEIEVTAWFGVTDWNEFQGLREEVFMQFMTVVEAAGTSMAFPTQTVHVVGGAPQQPAPASAWEG